MPASTSPVPPLARPGFPVALMAQVPSGLAQMLPADAWPMDVHWSIKSGGDYAEIDEETGNVLSERRVVGEVDDEINLETNQCMDCHAWSRAGEAKATKISITHFKSREGAEMSSVSPNRYFCNQCHVSQTDAKPLVGNTFKPGAGLR